MSITKQVHELWQRYSIQGNHQYKQHKRNETLHTRHDFQQILRAIQDSYEIFNLKKYSIETELSKYVWHLKENNRDFTIRWSTLKNSISHIGGPKRWNFCLEKKLSILKEKSKYLLKKRSELVSA